MSRDSKPRPPKRHSKREVAEALGVHPDTIRNWIGAGKLKGLTLADVVEFVRQKGK